MIDSDNKIITIKNDTPPEEGGMEITIQVPDDTHVMIEHVEEVPIAEPGEIQDAEEVKGD